MAGEGRMAAFSMGVGRTATRARLAAGQRAGGDEELGLAPSDMNWREMARILYPYFWPSGVRQRIAAVSCFVALGLSKVCNIASPAVLGIATNQMIRGEMPYGMLALYGALRFGVSAFEEIQRLVYLRVKQVAYHEIAVRTFTHLHALSLHWHINKRSGVVLRAMDRGISSASTVVDTLFLRMVPSIIEMIVMAAIFAGVYDSVGASWSIAIAFLLYFLVTILIARRRSKQRQKMHRADNEANQIAVDTLTAFETVKSFNNEVFEAGRYSAAVKTFQAATREQQASYVALNIIQSAVIRIATVAVLMFAAADVLAGNVSLGGFVALMNYVAQLFTPLSWLGTMYTMVVQAATDMRNLSDLLQQRADIVDAPGAHALALTSATGGPTIEFRNVVFSYPAAVNAIEAQMDAQRAEEEREAAAGATGGKVTSRLGRMLPRRGATPSPAASTGGFVEPDALPSGDGAAAPRLPSPAATTAPGIELATPAGPATLLPTLRGVSFTIRAGTTTAIVGPTGSGKSTLSKLLFRFYDVDSGAILVDGQDIHNVTQSSLRAAIGLVPQDCILFNDTLRFNIKYGRPTATDAEVAAAAAAAQIDEFVTRQKDGYDTRVGERGLRLSGGEKQRVAIARTLLKDPPILVLDEATSSLDTITEAHIQAAIARVRTGRTVLCIAHRLSTIRDADEIIVLANGVVAERGTHEALLAAGGHYARLWNQQAAASLGVAPPGSGDEGGELRSASAADAAAAPSPATAAAWATVAAATAPSASAAGTGARAWE